MRGARPVLCRACSKTVDCERIRAYYDRTAPKYDASIRPVERLLLGDSRLWAASLARGDVLELGIGTGRNLPYYPPGVRLIGVDISPTMLAIARDRARELQLDIDLRQGEAESLPFEAASFDTVVCTLALCSVLGQLARIGACRRQRFSSCSRHLTSSRLGSLRDERHGERLSRCRPRLLLVGCPELDTS